MKTLDTLVPDIYELFDPSKDHTCNEDNLNLFADKFKDLLRTRLAQPNREARPIRFSALGKPDRQVWYDAHDDGSAEVMTSKTYFKFLYGDVIEQLVLFLAAEAGHSVEGLQKGVEIDGVTGSIDAIIDGVVVDVKSASPFGYKKFKDRTVTSDDPFGYVQQLAGYASELTPNKPAAWIAFDKVAGDICVTPLALADINKNKPAPRIAQLQKVVASEEIPNRCHEPVPDGKSGNMCLPTPCSYCKWKHRCHPSLRTFLYSNGPKFLTSVERLPNVPEVGGKEFPNEIV